MTGGSEVRDQRSEIGGQRSEVSTPLTKDGAPDIFLHHFPFQFSILMDIIIAGV